MKPAITIYIDRDNDKYTVVFPAGLRDQFDLGFVEVSPAEDQAMKDHGAETNTAERDRLMLEPANDFIELV